MIPVPGADTLRADGVVVLLDAPEEIDGVGLADERGRVDASADPLMVSEVSHDIVLVANYCVHVIFIIALIFQDRLTEQSPIVLLSQFNCREFEVVEFVADGFGGCENFSLVEGAFFRCNGHVDFPESVVGIKPADGVIDIVVFHRVVLQMARDIVHLGLWRVNIAVYA